MNTLMLLAADQAAEAVRKPWIHRSGPLGGFFDWFTKSNSLQATETDVLGYVILGVSIFFFVMLMTLMVWFVIKYRRRPGVPSPRSATHNTPLELAWSIIPLLILVVIFFMGFQGYLNKLAAPVGAEEIYVTGRQWQWSAKYSTGVQPTEYRLLDPAEKAKNGAVISLAGAGEPVPVIPVPAGKPVKIILQSKDVMHSFFIPDFRMKMDVFPNRYTSMWFEARDAGEEHVVFCAEYCGDNHSAMAAILKVMPRGEFEKFINTKPPLVGPISEIGKQLRQRYGCNVCHTIDGTPGSGPSWKTNAQGEYGWGTPRTFEDGTSIPHADMTYFRDSILYSQKEIVKGFTSVTMPTFAGTISDDDVNYLIMYIKYLNGVIPDEHIGSKEEDSGKGSGAGADGAASGDAGAQQKQ